MMRSQECATTPHFYAFLKECLTPFKVRLFFIFLLSLCWTFREIGTPYLLKMLVDSVTAINSTGSSPEQLSSTILLLLTLIAAAWIVMEVCMRLQGAILLHTMPLIRAAAREKILEGVKNYPYDFFSSQMTGHIADKVLSTAKGTENLLHIFLITFVPICALFVFSLVILWSIYPMISLIFLIWMMGHFIITWRMSKFSLSKSKIFAQAKSTLHGKIVDIIANISTMQTFCRHQYEQSYLRAFQNGEILSEQHSLRFLEKIKLYLGVSGIFILIVTLGYSYAEWEKGVISTGDMTFIIVLLLNLTGYLWYLSMEAVRFLEEFGVVKENLESLIAVRSRQPISSHRALRVDKGSLSIRNLSFGYDPNTLVLDNINFSVQAKEKVALTGMSGSGKTTLMNLILGHLSLQEGQILIDDQNIKELSLESLRQHISIVPQNPGLFHRSVKENICYGKLDATDQEIFEAAKIAGCHDFILRLNQGYDTLVGEKGDKLSGGQKQRIAIARAILKNAPILILDEPTSSLDIKTEELFIANLFTHIQNKTVILITHRTTISTRLDRIIRI
ncbi:MAG: ABC transporter ATP-binding protein [Chlamydiales bacterium]